MYLNKLDIINKYNLKSLHDYPSIKKIVIIFSFNEFQLDEISSNDKLKNVFISSFISGNNPVIRYKIEKNYKAVKENVSHKLVLQEKSDIENFLSFLHIDCDHKFWSLLKFKRQNIKKDLDTLSFQLPIVQLADMSEFLKLNVKSSKIKDINLSVNMEVLNPTIDSIENIYPFWYRG
jgi:hypothetical protein